MIARVILLLMVCLALGLASPGVSGAAGKETATGGRFILQNHLGKVVTDEDFAGKFMLIYFGYTYCPDVCPTGLQTMSYALDLIGDDARHIQPLFITVDPGRDTQVILRDYVKAFHSRLVGLTGTEAAIKSVTGKYRVKFSKVIDKDDAKDEYLMDHTSAIFLMGPDGKYLARFSFNTSAEKMAEKMRSFTAKLKTN